MFITGAIEPNAAGRNQIFSKFIGISRNKTPPIGSKMIQRTYHSFFIYRAITKPTVLILYLDNLVLPASSTNQFFRFLLCLNLLLLAVPFF